MIKQALTICAALAASASIGSAQQTKLPVELGVDARLFIGFDSPQVTTVSIPVPAIRLGFFVNDRVSVEPKIGIQALHVRGGSATTYDVETGILFHFENNPVGRGLYARPFAGVVGFAATGASDTQTLFGGGLGIKESFAEKFASRIEVNYSHLSAPNNGSSTNSLDILFGISVFSK